MKQIKRIRQEIAAGAPRDDAEMRRMALRATGRISDPAVAERLQARLLDDLLHLVLARELGAVEQIADAMRDVEALLGEIERLSKPQ